MTVGSTFCLTLAGMLWLFITDQSGHPPELFGLSKFNNGHLVHLVMLVKDGTYLVFVGSSIVG